MKSRRRQKNFSPSLFGSVKSVPSSRSKQKSDLEGPGQIVQDENCSPARSPHSPTARHEAGGV